jgi:hypothetical protein
MRSGLFGVTRPRTEALRGLLIGPRSLLYTSPLLVLGLLGHGISLARARQRWTAIFSLIVIVYGILLNASYIYWNGGWTYGPRHLTIVLPFLALGLPPLFDAIWRYVRPLAWVALVAGVFLTFIVVSTEGMTPEDIHGPLFKHYWPVLRQGRVALGWGYTDSGGPATNFGLALGLPQKRSLFPFLVGFVVAGTGLLISLRQPARRARSIEMGDAPTEDRADPLATAPEAEQHDPSVVA